MKKILGLGNGRYDVLDDVTGDSLGQYDWGELKNYLKTLPEDEDIGFGEGLTTSEINDLVPALFLSK